MKKLFVFMFFIFLIPLNVYALSDTAKSTIVMDIDSGRILYEKNANEQRLVASITKIMTSVIAIENCNLNDEVTAGEEILSMYGSNIYIELGEVMSLRNLLYGLLLRSGNDAAVVIANYVGGDEEKFVQMMNDKAKEIGMTKTVFKNPHGLDEKTKNYSTAHDMALLSSYAYSLKEYRKISSTKKWIVQSDKKSYVWNNRNKLLYSYEYATGGKTGYTPSSGRTLVTTASKDNLNLTVVTLSDNNEYVTHESLYEYAFNKYRKYLIVDKDNFTVNNNFFKNNCYIKESFAYPLTNDEKEKVNVILRIEKQDNFKNNEVIGSVVVNLEDKEIFKTNIFGIQNKKNNTVIDKIVNFIKNLFK
ncbi:MAG: D-alanyl-D-alanine carboxypeptidase [bacterium]|nr:D-alanyl-D-alanine carboxypeptidase [bacterium]